MILAFNPLVEPRTMIKHLARSCPRLAHQVQFTAPSSCPRSHFPMLKYNRYSLPHILFRYNTELVGSSKKDKRTAHDLNPMFRLMLSETSGCLVTDNGETTTKGIQMDPRKGTVMIDSVYFPVHGECGPSRVDDTTQFCIRPGKVICVVAGVRGSPAQHSCRARSCSASASKGGCGCTSTDIKIVVVNRKERHTFLKKETSCCDESRPWHDQ